MPSHSEPKPGRESVPSGSRSNSDKGSARTAAGGSRPAGGQVVERVLNVIRDAGIEQVELQFADVTGAVKSVAVPARRIQGVLAEGEWFDGSAIEGLAREVESDMYLRPDPNTFAVIEPGAYRAPGSSATF